MIRPIRRFFLTFLPPKRVILCRHREVESACPICRAEKAAKETIRKLRSVEGVEPQ